MRQSFVCYLRSILLECTMKPRFSGLRHVHDRNEHPRGQSPKNAGKSRFVHGERRVAEPHWPGPGPGRSGDRWPSRPGGVRQSPPATLPHPPVHPPVFRHGPAQRPTPLAAGPPALAPRLLPRAQRARAPAPRALRGVASWTGARGPAWTGPLPRRPLSGTCRTPSITSRSATPGRA